MKYLQTYKLFEDLDNSTQVSIDQFLEKIESNEFIIHESFKINESFNV